MVIVLLTAALFTVDYLVKRYVNHNVKENEPAEALDEKGYIAVQRIYNEGAAMGFLRNHKSGLNVITIVAIVLFLLSIPKNYAHTGWCGKLGYAMVLGGAFNNAYERLLHGRVTDYVSFPKLPGKIKNIVFNLSDFFVMIGAVLVAVAQIKREL